MNNENHRQIVLDTETTGLNPSDGHRIIEIGCVELINRRLTGNDYHMYIQPDREIEAEAIAVHGITNEFLADKPKFASIASSFLDYIGDAELVIHNAAFDIGFLNHEVRLMSAAAEAIDERCPVVDTLTMARQLHPGARASLDALCKRYDIDNSHREPHGALLDAQIVAGGYLMMTGGQSSLVLDAEVADSVAESTVRKALDGAGLPVISATSVEADEHQRLLVLLEKASGQPPLWLRPQATKH